MTVTKKNAAGMVDVSAKKVTARKAVATGSIQFTSKSFNILMTQGSPKGDVFEIARVSGIMAAKRTPDILPLCHPLLLEKVKVTLEPNINKHTVNVTAEVLCQGKTGVEMEALTAVSAACLCVYDLMKWSSQDMTIGSIQLMHKSGGKTGVFNR